MSLEESLAKLREASSGKIPEEIRMKMGAATKAIKESGIMDGVIKVGDKLPSFNLPNSKGVMVSSDDLLAKGNLVVTIYRGHWWPYCNAELYALRDIVDGLNENNTTMVAISPQNQDKNDELVEKHKLNFDLLRDEGNGYCNELGIVMTVAQEIQDIYGGFGIDLPTSNGESSWTLPMPTRLVVSQDGIVRAADIDANHTTRPEPQKTLDDVKAL